MQCASSLIQTGYKLTRPQGRQNNPQ